MRTLVRRATGTITSLPYTAVIAAEKANCAYAEFRFQRTLDKYLIAHTRLAVARGDLEKASEKVRPRP